MKDMIGRVVRLMVDVPLHMLGAICDLLEKLASKENGEVWFRELKNFLLKKPCWTEAVESVSPFLTLLSGRSTLVLDALDGKDILAEASDKWGANERGEATEEMNVEVYELAKDSNFSQFFLSAGDVSKICLTQAQIKNFVVKHHHWLSKYGSATFFLFKSHGQLFVAYVSFSVAGSLEVDVVRFENDYEWAACYCHRVVIPQVA